MKFKFNFNTDFFESLFTSEKPIEDVYVDYALPGVGQFNLKVFDIKYLIDGIAYFRPFIRGFIVLLLAIFNVRQFQSFIGFDAGVAPGGSTTAITIRKEQ